MNNTKFKITPRHLLLPFVLFLYKREPIHSRGQYLKSFGFVPGDEYSTMTIVYGRFEGLRSGNLVFSSQEPHVIISRKDGIHISHSFF